MSKFEIIVLVLSCLVLSTNCDEKRSGTAPDQSSSSRVMYPNDFLLLDHYHPSLSRDRRIPQHNSHHNAKFYVYEESEPAPADVIDYEESNDYSNSSINEIPLDFIQTINKYNVTDLLLNFVEGDIEDDEPFVRSRFGTDGEEYEARSAAVTPKPAGCTPELKTISLGNSEDPSILYIPQCTKVERCGGCCSHKLLSCQPKEVETLTYQIMKTQYTGAKKLKFLEKEIVHVERHVKCKCDCKVKEEQCTKYQEYRPSECRCVCTNIDEEKKCYKSGSKKLWNSELCACQCREALPCSTGLYFDQIECRCMPNPKRRYANYDRRGYVTTESLTITPLANNDDY